MSLIIRCRYSQLQRKTLWRFELRRGFSMIEMLIVIGIIVLLAGLTLGISNAVLRGSEIRKTEDALTLLDTALKEWETEMGRTITFQGIAAIDGRYDIDNDGVIEEPTWGGQGVDQDTMNNGLNERAKDIWELLNENEASKNILAKIHPDLILKDDDDRKRVVDAWGSPLGIVFAGRDYAGSGFTLDFPKDECGDLTVRDEAEDALGSCINRKPYFVSAGPDGAWGYRFQANGGSSSGNNSEDDLWVAAQDNIYSYEPFIVEESR
ncbi:MAG: type II secretion system protein [Phycisphaerales bacterium]|jgi:prepilin-type N-terminal cleavage/methylation domain-containing protein|nr:type II secretion system protein [Phycisphaerales bacterium]